MRPADVPYPRGVPAPRPTSRLAGFLAALVGLAIVTSACQASDAGEAGTGTGVTGEERLRYVALGDSYTAAPLFPLKESINGCLRSSGNYPTLVAEAEDLAVVDVSCSGASTTSMTSRQNFTDRSRPPQLDALKPDTQLVTIGIGANDFRYFSAMMFDCLAVAESDPEGAPCRELNDRPRQERRLALQLTEIRANVARVVDAIGERSPEARIMLIGYPQLLPATGQCRNKLPLAVGDWDFVRDLNLRLAQSVEGAAADSGAEFVDLVQASQGHDICSAEPWVAGVRGDPSRAMGLHPYPAEQRAVAELIAELL